MRYFRGTYISCGAFRVKALAHFCRLPFHTESWESLTVPSRPCSGSELCFVEVYFSCREEKLEPTAGTAYESTKKSGRMRLLGESGYSEKPTGRNRLLGDFIRFLAGSSNSQDVWGPQRKSPSNLFLPVAWLS